MLVLVIGLRGEERVLRQGIAEKRLGVAKKGQVADILNTVVMSREGICSLCR